LSERPSLEVAGSLGFLLRKEKSGFANLESQLRPVGEVLKVQSSYRMHLGVREIDKPTYEIRGEYRRYNQKNNLTIGRPSWDPILCDKLKESEEQNMRSLAEKGVPGYTLYDYALADAAYTIASTLGTDINYPNSGFLSWSPLRRPTYEDIGIKKIAYVDEAKMSRLIKKLGIWFGASLVRLTSLDRRWVYSNCTTIDLVLTETHQ